MKRQVVIALVSFGLAAPAFAGDEKKQRTEEQSNQQMQQQEQAATGGAGMPQDLSKQGPWTRKPTDEKKSRQEIQTFFKQDEASWKKGDFQATLANVDFPIMMITDDSKGTPKAEPWTREQWTQMMQPMMEQAPKDMEFKHNYTINVLSDSLATYADNFTMKAGGKSYQGKNSGVLVKRDGQWKFKSIIEPGWGDMPSQGVGGTGAEGTQPMEQQPTEQQQPSEQQPMEQPPQEY